MHDGLIEMFYCVESADAWGDDADPLPNVDSGVTKRIDRGLTAQSSGPVMPPVALFGSILVTDSFKNRLQAEYAHLKFRQVIKQVVEGYSEESDREHSPKIHPPVEKPEHRLFEILRSPTAPAKIGPLWEVVMCPGARARIVPGESTHESKLAINLKTWSGKDFFVVEAYGSRYPIVTEQGRQWFEQEVGNWVRFIQLLTE